MTPMKIRITFCLMASLAVGLGSIPTVDAHGMSKKERNTLIGVGIGAIGGAVLSNGDMWSTIAGAAAGGVIGNVTTKNERRHRHDRRYRDHHHHYRGGHRH